jgi:hypothetical protein
VTKLQLRKQLQFLLKDLTKVSTRTNKIADKLNIDKHEGVESALNEVKTLLELMEKENADPKL